MKTATAVVVIAGALIAGGVGLARCFGDRPSEPVEGDSRGDPPRDADGGAPVAAPDSAVARDLTAGPGSDDPESAPLVTPLELPDGARTAPLNGVTKPAPMTWGDRDYSPIVGTVWQDRIEWYVHANGSRTTTVDLWRKDLDRFDAVTVVVHQGEPSPIEGLEQLGPIRGRSK